MIGRVRSGYGTILMRRRALFSVVGVLIVIIIVFVTIFMLITYKNASIGGDSSVALKSWNAGNYDDVYVIAKKNAVQSPLSSFWLVMHGMASYQIAVAQINQGDTLKYIDESITAIRKALIIGAGSMDSKARYVLGKAYYRKGPQYADQAVEYLEQAINAKFSASDIYEHLGLAYASIKEYRASVIAFSKALGENPSDLLLLAIARSYSELGENDQAKAYLLRCAETSKDVSVAAQARLLLGFSYKKLGMNGEAEKEYLAVLDQDGRNADAYYALGDLYAESGDAVKARAEWRKALRIDPTHGPSRSRLGM
ncbi:MAG: tetratricopeptide repeat protein [Treponemataceae bacterium]